MTIFIYNSLLLRFLDEINEILLELVDYISEILHPHPSFVFANGNPNDNLKWDQLTEREKAAKDQPRHKKESIEELDDLDKAIPDLKEDLEKAAAEKAKAKDSGNTEQEAHHADEEDQIKEEISSAEARTNYLEQVGEFLG